MNKSYRTVWNATTGTWVAAEETARSKSKGSSRVARKAFVAVTLGGVAIGGAAAADFGDALESTDGTGDEESVVQVPITSAKSLASSRAIGTDAIGTMAALDDTYIKVAVGGIYSPAIAAQAGSNAIAIGGNARASGMSGLAIGGTTVASGQNAVAIGNLSNATNSETVAVGVGASATASYASALGRSASATATGSTALGTYSVADRANSVSVGNATTRRQITNLAAGTQTTDAVNLSQLTPIVTALGGGATINATTGAVTGPTYNLTNGGRQTTVGGALTALDGVLTRKLDNTYFKANSTAGAATADGAESIAIGGGANARGANSVALGAGARVALTNTSVPVNGIAIGVNALVGDGDIRGASGSISIGDSASSGGFGSISLGANASGTGSGATSIGSGAFSQRGVAVGASAHADANNSTALGVNATSTATNGVALGNASLADRANSVSVGSSTLQRQITNLAAGTQDTDAVNVAQLNAAIANVGSDSPYFQANGAGDGSDAASAVGAGSVAVGSNASTVADGGVAIGNNAKSTMQNGVAIGNAAVASEDGVAIGRDAHAQSANSLAFGAQSSAAANGTSLGFNAKAADNAMALGANTVAAGSNSVALGNGSVASVANTVSVGSAGNERKIVNVADGDLSATSTDAVNGSQLFATNTRVGSLEDSLKGGGVIDPTTGESLAVVYDDATKAGVTLGNAGTPVAIHNVAAGDLSATSTDAVNGSQLFATNQSVGDLRDSLQNGGVIDPVTGQSLAVTYDDATKAGVTLGNAGTPVAIHNVAAGDLSATSTDAVNGSQLFATNTRVGSLEDSLQSGGVIDPTTGQSLAVVYDDATKAGVTLGNAGTPVAIHNVAAGDLSATSTDAVNGSQLFATNQSVGDLRDSLQNGGVIDPVTGQSLAVTYDDATKAGVTLGNAGTPVAIHNVAAGDLSATSTDAVNGSQLFATNTRVGSLEDSLQNGGVIDPATGESLAVVYDSAAKNHVTLGGAGASGPVTLSNVAAGVAATDAVNVQQMQQAVATGNPYIGGRGTGVAAQATGINAVALGLGSLANEINTISVGNSTTGLQRRITNVQNGEADSDAATVGQVNELMGVASTSTQAALDNIDTKTTSAIQDVNSRLDAINAVAGTDPYVQVDGAGDGSDNASVRPGTYGVAIGAEANATGNTAIAIGAQSVSSGNSSVALGAGASATATGAVAFGSGRATGTSALALGNGTNASGNNAVAAGFNAGASGLNALAFGNTARANATDSMAFGTTAQVDPLATNGIAIGRAANVTSAAQNSVALGSNSVADRLNSISVGSTSQQRQIIYVSKGTADTDAVNVSQLKDAVSAFGGNASVGADGSIVNPTYTFDGATYHNVGDALNALAQRGGGSDPLAVTYAKNPDGSANFDLVSLAGVDGTTLTNLKAGALSATSTDAVNGSQLFATNQDLGDLRDSLQSGGVIDPTTGESLAVVYDGTAKDKVTLGGGATGTTIANVKAGVADLDAVNVSQLKGSGLIDPVTGQSIAAVTYDRNPDGTANYGSVTLGNGNGPVKVSNVADATGDSDALNLGQLKQAGLVGEDGQGNLTSLAVAYDDASKGTVTLGGGAAGTTITNVKAGELSATSTDAVNGAQLFATNTRVGSLEDSLQNGGVIDPVTGESLAVVYDSTAKDKVTLAGGATGTTISNVKAGVADLDAVNVSQLKGSGLIDPVTGQSIAAVTYDRLADGTANYGSVTLGNGNGPVKVSNVAAATADTDAVNYGQMKDYVDGSIGVPGNPLAVAYDDTSKGSITLGGANGTTITNVAAGEVSATSTDAINGSQLHGVSQSVADSLGGGSTVGADGTVTNPTYSLADPADASQKHDYHNVGDALANLDGRVVDNTTNITVIKNQLSDSGLVDPVTGQSIAAVTYDRNADGTPNYNSATLRGTDGTTLSNVKAGVADLDAVNVSQLKGSGLIDPITGQSIAAVTYDRNPDGTANYGSVTLGNGNGPVKVTNVADATGDSDALNLGQLKQAGLVGEDGQGNLTSLAVAYDDASKGTVTLGGGAAGTTITNVKAGELSATSTDAVNGSQLFATNQDIGDLRDSLKGGGVIDPVTGESLAVVYDSAAKNQVTLGGKDATTPVQLKNVAAGTDGTDAVNVAQLKEAGLVAPVDPTNPGAGLTSLAVTYGDASKSTVALGGANGTTLSNVAAGAVSATSTDAINGSQLHGVSQSVADSLGGGSTVGADGTVTNPTYSLADPADASQKQDYHNVGDALANLDGRVVDNTTNITVIKNQLADSGLVDPVTGQSIAAVTYDRNTDGTPNYGSVTLGNGNDPVKVSNVADGVDRHDAVNLGQLQDAGLVAPVDPTNPGTMTSLAVTYGKNTDGTANFDQVVLAGKGGTTISNVKAGAVTATSTDAINGAQLHGVSQSVADSLGGGSTVDADGKVTSPTYVVNNQTFNNVGDAITNISNSLVDGSIGLVQQDATTRDITVAKDTDGTVVDFTGTAGDRVLTGVAAGAVNATSNDAINGSQLHGTAQSVADVIGGGTTVDADGKLADTAIDVNGQKYSTVAEAVQAAAAYGATDSLAVRYDLNGDGTPNFGSVTLGGSGAAPVQLKNVADGVNKYDAVNFGQLSELNDKIDDMDGRVGALEQNPGNGGGTGDSPYFSGTDVTPGSSTAANAGTGTGNTAAGSGASVGGGANNATVIGSNASATKDNGAAIGSGAKSTGEGATAIGSNASASGSQSVAIGSGSVANEANTVSFGNGTDDGNRRIVNIADGINATDGATKGQLDRAVGGLQGQINDVSKNAYSGIAAATALTMIPGVDPGKTLSFGVGGATYKGYQAVAFGGEARITQNLKMKAGVGLSSGGNTVGVGASYQW